LSDDALHQKDIVTAGYGIRADYRVNPVNITSDDVSGAHYWTESRIELSRRYQWSAYRRAAQLAAQEGVRTVVDVGCGVGTKLVEFFHSFDIYGVDQASAVKVAGSLDQAGTYIADDFDNPRPSLLLPSPADMVICSDVIEHVVDPDQLLSYIRGMSDGHTLMILTTPDRAALYGADCLAAQNPFHVREWTFHEFGAYLRSQGLRIIDHSLLLPFKLEADRMTAGWVKRTMRGRRRFRTNQYVVCRMG
jgi:SAM-dependent methyltransferase